jgi:hypothetical protein
MANTMAADAQEQFFAVVCEDEDFLRAEFEAIIDANWDRDDPPLPTPVRPGYRGRVTRTVKWKPATDPSRPAEDSPWGRQRSPPEAAAGSDFRRDPGNGR